MKAIEVVRLVVESSSARLYQRQADGSYKVRSWNVHMRGWTLLDLTTAGYILAIFNAVSDQHKPKFELFSLDYMIRFSYKAVA